MPVNGIRLLAHRGAVVTSPENTLEALACVRAEGADGVELDVRLSADGEPFLFHDDDGARLTGIAGPVARLTWSELKERRVFGKYRIPHLEDALGFLESWPDASLFIDLHENSTRLAEVAGKRIGACAARERVSVLDFFWHRDLLLRARHVAPHLRLSVMPGTPWNVDRAIEILSPVEICMGWDDRPVTRPLYRFASRLFDVPSRLRRARDAGIRVSGGVANTVEDIHYVLGQGVDGVWTDDLVLARRVLENVS